MYKKNSSTQNKELTLKFQTLPTFAQRLISYIHYKTGAAAELILIVLLGAMAYACQDKFDVQLKNGRTFTSLYLMLLARSGSRKSTVFKMLMETIYRLEKGLKDDFLVEKMLYERKRAAWKAELKKLNKKFNKADAAEEFEALKALEECQGREPVEPVRPRLIIHDSTIEGLIKALALGSPSLMLGSDEAGGLFDGNLFRNTPALNSIWGEGRIADSRASRDSYDVDDARLSMLLMMQPSLFDYYLGKQGKIAKDLGFLARLLLIDLEQVPELCDIPDACSWSDEPGLDGFFSILVKHLQDGIERREKNEERICITLSEEAKALWDTQSKRIRELMQKGEELHHYDDFGSRIMEQGTRIAAVMQMFITPDLPIITKETLESATKITQWIINHLITKVDATREPTTTEKLVWFMEDHLVSNGSYDFRRNDLIKKGPYSARRSEILMPALEKLESEGIVQLFERGGINYVKFIGSKMEPAELAERTNIPLINSGSVAMNKLRLPE
ncbi:YfjI family protein [Enterobacter hormaechei]|uniref:YfjI family protein n=1 Tax=Enterobacter hormaechei TaxID=158836 RepID=UPI0023E447D1|nr:YfjI family protein [Enterobacter hormaechei]MDF3591337.1 YfjI family protein [Enterobacter hormaechei]